MAHPTKTQAELLEIFKDGQLPGSITPEDVRDLIISLTPTSATGRFTSPAVIEIATIGTMTSPSSGTSAIINATDDIIMPQDGRIQYIGSAARHFIISVSISATVDATNEDLRFQLTRNGLAMAETIIGRSWDAGTDEGSLSIITGTILLEDDYIEIQAANDSSTADITIVNGVIVMHGTIM
jgi:hypothetical protein